MDACGWVVGVREHLFIHECFLFESLVIPKKLVDVVAHHLSGFSGVGRQVAQEHDQQEGQDEAQTCYE